MPARTKTTPSFPVPVFAPHRDMAKPIIPGRTYLNGPTKLAWLTAHLHLVLAPDGHSVGCTLCGGKSHWLDDNYGMHDVLRHLRSKGHRENLEREERGEETVRRVVEFVLTPNRPANRKGHTKKAATKVKGKAKEKKASSSTTVKSQVMGSLSKIKLENVRRSARIAKVEEEETIIATLPPKCYRKKNAPSPRETPSAAHAENIVEAPQTPAPAATSTWADPSFFATVLCSESPAHSTSPVPTTVPAIDDTQRNASLPIVAPSNAACLAHQFSPPQPSISLPSFAIGFGLTNPDTARLGQSYTYAHAQDYLEATTVPRAPSLAWSSTDSDNDYDMEYDDVERLLTPQGLSEPRALAVPSNPFDTEEYRVWQRETGMGKTHSPSPWTYDPSAMAAESSSMVL